MDIKLLKTEKSTAHIESFIDNKEIDQHKDHVIDEMLPSITVKGFRQGKAPKSIAAAHVDPDKLSDRLLNHIFSEIIDRAITENKLRLIGRPVLENLDTKGETGWTIKMSLPLYPEVKLGDYKNLFSKKTTPKKAKTEKEVKDKTNEETEESKLENIYQTLLKDIELDIPASVIDEEVNYSLDRLVSQAKSLNLSFENYLKAVNKTIDEVKNEYRTKAAESIKLDLILLAIAKEEKIDTDPKELVELAKQSSIPESQLGQLKSVMDRRKTIEFLAKL